jgi:uncharacterized protein (DUF885 family)
MVRHRIAAFVCSCLAAAACSRPAAPPAQAADGSDRRVRALADAYLAGYFERFPEAVTMYGVLGHRQNALIDNSLAAQEAWEAREDAWLAELKQIEPATIASAPLRATYAIARNALEGAAAKRVCRDELWNVSEVTGWQIGYGYLVTIQPVGTDAAREEALARWRRLPGFIDTEIANLREGIALGYTAPKLNVRTVIEQIRALAATPLKDSPFDSPPQRDKTPAFQQAFNALATDALIPAARRYADFLQKEYLPAAREAIAISANPNGAACYEASILAHSSSPKTAKEVHALGLEQVEALTKEMQAIGERSFGTGDVPALLQRLRTDPAYRFKSRQEKIAYSQAALARAKQAIPERFGLLPKADVVITPYPAFREKNAPNEYNPPAEDGSRPAVFFISAYQADKQNRAPDQSTAFHETIPGHHMQVAIALERKDIHPIGRYISNSGYVEGWALYAERLADDMHLYTGDLDRLGMLSSQAFRASRLVVDSGLHALGWSRQRAIDYMLAHSAETEHSVAGEIDRYIIWPGQATAYMIGMLEIRAAREEAERALGPRFDLKAFHDRVLEDGAVPLTFLREKIRRWEGIKN